MSSSKKAYSLKPELVPEQKAKSAEQSAFRHELNQSQWEAVSNTEGPQLVIAGAGSGKTRTLVYRVAHLVEKGVDPAQILLLTFTRKAAAEMTRRASQLLDGRCNQVAGGTFHSFANLLLRKYGKHIDLTSQFTILDRGDTEDVIQLIRTEFNYHKLGKRFPRKKTILNIISRAFNRDLEIEEVVEEQYPHFEEYCGELTNIQERFAEYKFERAMLDYDDLLIYLKLLLTTCSDIRRKVSQQYRYVMVDEYQDTNRVQAHLAALLASEHQNLMVVGDDSQSIYSFRGAHFQNIMDFPKLFSGTRVIKLEENYRSRQPILDLTNQIIAGAHQKYEKELYTTKAGQQKPVFIETKTENEQSQFVAQRILELREEGVELSDIAVLFRNGWHSNDLEVELSALNIPFLKFGGIKFVEAAHIKDVLAHLKVSFNPQDSISWLRILLLLEGVGPKTARDISQSVAEHGLKSIIAQCYSKKKYYGALQRLYELIDDLQACKDGLGEQVYQVNNYYRSLLKSNYDDFNKRLPDLESLENIAQRYSDLEEFLVDLTLEPPDVSQVDVNATDKDDEKLCLSTIHSSKGLEWHSVFIIYTVDGFLPSARSVDDPEQLEEERRLFYVACTRAKENLYLVKPSLLKASKSFWHQGQNGFHMTTRFLVEEDIIQRFCEQWTIQKDEPINTKQQTEAVDQVMARVNEFFSKNGRSR
tara:strand:+ start:12 stop:2114 length:2103 start_codon:yes stop_codon:yes gene_type:complete